MGNAHSNLPTYYNADPTNEAYAHSLSGYVDLASEAVGAKVIRASNERFGAAGNLIKTRQPQSSSGKPDAWVTRRHNPEADWAVIRLGCAGTIAGFNIDTTGLDGEHAFKVSIQGCLAPEDAQVDDQGEVDGVAWDELLPVVELGPDSRHLLALWNATEAAYNFVRLTLHPDGGVARLRILGTVVANPEAEGEVDLASVNSGARVIGASDEKLGAKENLILPGRASADSPETQGWKTRRSRTAEHSDWAIVQLGEPGFLTRIELDTHLYDGDQPVSAAVQACYTEMENPERDPECFWYQIVPRTELNGNELHKIDVSLNDVPFSHIKLVIHPDGGIGRVRAYGQRVKEIEEEAAREEAEAAAEAVVAAEAGLDADTPAAEEMEDVEEEKEEAEKPIETIETIEVVVTKEITTADEEKSTEEESHEEAEREEKEELKTPAPRKKTKRSDRSEKPEKADKTDKTDKTDKARTSPRKKASRAKRHLSAEDNEILSNDQFSSRAGELIQSLTSTAAAGLTSPSHPKKRSRTRSRTEDDTDDASVNTVDSSQPKRSRRKPKVRHQTAA
ncbi:galactose-binding like protein [Martensiomyces pterosporus]|nr:galactose-binding like protein [Martensiomyces pterosporus]